MTDRIDLEPKIIEKIVVQEVIKETVRESPKIVIEKCTVGTSPIPVADLSVQTHFTVCINPKKKPLPSLSSSTIESIVFSTPQLPCLLSIALNTVTISRLQKQALVSVETKLPDENVTKLQSSLN